MRILLVAMADSIHTSRWVSQISDQGWDVHLFPSLDVGFSHSKLKNCTVHHSFYGKEKEAPRAVTRKGIPVFDKNLARLGRALLRKYTPSYRVAQLARLIRKLEPDVIHAMEMQAAGYLTVAAKERMKGELPPSIITSWGSDIYLFGRLKEHEPQIRRVLSAFDYYSCECQRDVDLAKAYGFKGDVLPVFPNSGGFELEQVFSLRSAGPVSERRSILLKGYQNWAGRALVGIRALERCADLLRGYEVNIYSAKSEVKIAAELFEKSTGVPTRIIPEGSSHEEMLKLHGRSRISIGLSISDAISTSLLEAMVMGSFPVQAYTSCADEWIVDGETGILVPPEDPDVVEMAIRRALTDDTLVNRAAEKNFRVANERLDRRKLKERTISLYHRVLQDGRRRQKPSQDTADEIGDAGGL
jgi:glycosyltransferase involved in cell wall biosynthesis